MLELGNRQLSTILAALRQWQESLENLKRINLHPAQMDQWNIATNNNTLIPLSIEEIDELCEYLNTGVE